MKNLDKINRIIYYIGLSYAILCSVVSTLIALYNNTFMIMFDSSYIVAFAVLLFLVFAKRFRVFSALLALISLLFIYDMTWNHDDLFNTLLPYNYPFYSVIEFVFFPGRCWFFNSSVYYFILLFFELNLLYIGIFYTFFKKKKTKTV
jgi:hypothetical protein